MAKLDALSSPPCPEVEAQRLFDICASLGSVGADPYRAIPHDDVTLIVIRCVQTAAYSGDNGR